MNNLKETLDQLHTELAKELLKRVKDRTATAADLSAARQFLKDNNTTAHATPNNPLGQLAGLVPFPTEGDAAYN